MFFRALKQYNYQRKVDNFYHRRLYSTKYSRLSPKNNPRRSNRNAQRDSTVNNGYFDPYRNSSFAPGVPLIRKWKYIRSDVFLYQHLDGEPSPPFRLYLEEVLREMGTLEDIQVGKILEFLYTLYYLNFLLS